MLRKKQQTQLHKKNSIIILIGLIYLLGLSNSFAQSDSSHSIDSTNDPTAVETHPTPTPSASITSSTNEAPKDTEAPVTAPQNKTTDEAEEIDAELIKRQHELEKSFGTLYQGTSSGRPAQKTEALFDHESAIKNYASMMNNKLSKDDLKKMKLHEAVSEALKPIQLLSEQEILSQLKNNIKGTKSEKYLSHFPQSTIIAVKIIKDKNALPELAKILEDKDKLIKCSAILLCTILFGFLLKKIVSSKSENLITIFGFFLLRVFIMFGIRIGIIFIFFGDNLRPILQIVLNNF